MYSMKKLFQSPYYVGAVSAVSTLALSLSIVSLTHPLSVTQVADRAADPVQHYDDDAKIKEIEQYLDTISPQFLSDVQALAEQEHLPSWGCGPSSYSLAKILNKKFFDNQLTLDASYDNHPYEIVERFGFALGNPLAEKGVSGVDHAWLEIYFNNRFLFIDPTVGQFGKIHKIAYEVFSIGSQNISKELLDKYGIEDVRLKLIVRKLVNRVPADQTPYPGMSLSPSTADYYLQLVKDRDEVDAGNMPSTWGHWVEIFTKKYS